MDPKLPWNRVFPLGFWGVPLLQPAKGGFQDFSGKNFTKKTLGWWLMIRYRFFFCGLVFLVFSGWEPNVKSFCIYMTYLRILVAQLLFHDEVYLLSSLSIWRKGWQLFFPVARRPWRRRRLKDQIRRCLFETHIFVKMDDDGWWFLMIDLTCIYGDLRWCY